MIVNSILVNNVGATITAWNFDSNSATGNGSFNYSGGTVNFDLVLNSDGTYSLTLESHPVVVDIDYNEYEGHVAASGPTSTYIISYDDVTTGDTFEAKVSAVAEDTPMSFLAYGETVPLIVPTVGTAINVSSDGIGIDNNILESYYKSGVYTTESLIYNPVKDADSITLAFTGGGANEFGGKKNDVIYIQVNGTNGETQSIMLSSVDGDYIINTDSSFTEINSSYTGGSLLSYTIDLPNGWDALESVQVTAGFYGIEATNVKMAFGFGITTETDIEQEIVIDFTAQIEDLDHDVVTTKFQVITDADNIIDGTVQDDVITGTDVSDILTGDEGDDIFIGGTGSDQFVSSSGADIITDYSQSEGDVLVLSDLLQYGDNYLLDHLSVELEGSDDVKINVLDHNGISTGHTVVLESVSYAGLDTANPVADLLTIVNIDNDTDPTN